MALTLAYVTDNPAQAVTVFSVLKSGGFNPEIFNFHHGFLAIAYVSALGGFRIMLPEDEIQEAQIFLQSTRPILDFDPIKPRIGRDIFYGSILTFNPFFGLLLLPLMPLILLYLLSMVWLLFLYPEWFVLNFMSNLLVPFVIAMRIHAECFALPALRKTHDPTRSL